MTCRHTDFQPVGNCHQQRLFGFQSRCDEIHLAVESVFIRFHCRRIDWCQHQGIEEAVAQIIGSHFQRFHSHFARQFGRNARVNFQLVFNNIQNVEFLAPSLSRIAGQGIVEFLHAEILLVIGKNLRLAIQQRRDD